MHLLVFLFVDQVIEELVMIQDIRVLCLPLIKVRLRHNLEQESKNSSEELRRLLLSFGEPIFDKVDDVQLQIHELSVDGVFRWSMEMELGCMEVCFWNMFIEQTDGRSGQVVEPIKIVVRLLSLKNRERVGLNHLIELVRDLWVDGLIVEVELVVLIILQDLLVGLEVDR